MTSTTRWRMPASEHTPSSSSYWLNSDANDVELSAAELETLREFDRFGGRAADVAKALGKSKFTVQNQIQSAIKKLGCSGRAEALAYARQRGWLDRASN